MQNSLRYLFNRAVGSCMIFDRIRNRGLLLLGTAITAVSLFLYLNPLQGIRRADTEGPFVLLSCNRQGQGLRVYITNLGTPTTSIVFTWEQDVDYGYGTFSDATFWLYVCDEYEFDWECKGDLTAVGASSTINPHDCIAAQNPTEGRSKGVLIRLDFSTGDPKTNELSLTSDEGHFLASGRGDLRLRIPWISPWMGEDSGFVEKEGQEAGQSPPGGKDIVGQLLGGEALYQPVTSCEVSVVDLSYLDDNLVLRSVEPSAEAVGIHLCWEDALFFLPDVRYEYVDSRVKDGFWSNACMMGFGLGLSILWEARKGWGDDGE